MKRWSLSSKFYFIVVLAALSNILLGFVGLMQMSKVQTKLEDIAYNYSKNIDSIFRLRVLYDEQIVHTKDLMLATNAKDVEKYWTAQQELHKDISAKGEGLHNHFKWPENKADIANFNIHYKKSFEVMTKIYEHVKKNEKDAAYVLVNGDLSKTVNQATEYINNITTRMGEKADVAATQAKENYSDSFKILLSIVISCIVGGTLTSRYVLKTLTQSINQVVSNLTEGSVQVTTASAQIAASSEELSQATTEQAASLEETAASIEEMTSMVQKNAENSKRTHELSVASSQSAEKGREVVTDMIQAIENISQSNALIMKQIDESNQKISDIVNVISEIGNKTKIINDIVFQTKLLSFNASVEAARAGEHGKGFAVVAEEVGNLAQMSGNAAKEISSMLESSIQKVEGIVAETKTKVSGLVLDGKQKVELGTQIASSCGNVLEEIVRNINTVAEMSHEISSACDEQYQGVQEITRAMNQLDQVTQSNAATSEESASAAEELSAQAYSLKQSIELLVQEIYGHNAKRVEETPVKQEQIATVYPLKKNIVNKQQPFKSSVSTPVKKVVGGFDNGIPSEDDPRFEEV